MRKTLYCETSVRSSKVGISQTQYLLLFSIFVHHTLSIHLGIQFMQRYGLIADKKQTKIMNVLVGP